MVYPLDAEGTLKESGYDRLYDRRKRRPGRKRVALKTAEAVLQLHRENSSISKYGISTITKLPPMRLPARHSAGKDKM